MLDLESQLRREFHLIAESVQVAPGPSAVLAPVATKAMRQQRHWGWAAASGVLAAIVLVGGVTWGREMLSNNPTPSQQQPATPDATEAPDSTLRLTLGSVDRVICPVPGKYGDAITEENVAIRSITICVPSRLKSEGRYFDPLTIKPTEPWQWEQVKTFTLPNIRRPADCPPDTDQYRVFVNTKTSTYLVYLPVDGCGTIRGKVEMALNRLVADDPSDVVLF